MSELRFRNLLPNEIQIRPTDTKWKGSATLLLYQDQRVAMNILDETVGPFGWQKKYEEVKGHVYCSIGIKGEDGEWVWKSDCGAESNMEAEKGEASDAAKRAAVCWGIGRELYTGPVVKIKCPDNYYYNDRLSMSFYVKKIEYDGKQITKLAIADKWDNIVFNWDYNNGLLQTSNEPKATTYQPTAQKPVEQPQNGSNQEILKSFCSEKKTEQGVDMEQLKKFFSFYNTRAEGWKGTIQPQTLWNKWMSTARN